MRQAASSATSGRSFLSFPLPRGWTSRATGLDFEFAAILVNVIAGAVAAVCLFTLVSRFADRAAALLVSAALTRGATVPLSAAALWYVWRHRAARRPSALVLMVAALAAPFLWIGIAAVVTGRRDAYAATQRAWATRRT